jgi:hypothetical protein
MKSDIGKIDFNNITISYEDDTNEIVRLLKYEFNNREFDEEDDFDEDPNITKIKDFSSLCVSLIEKGYDNTDDTIYVKKIMNKDFYVVLEGNRRISAIKILLNFDKFKSLNFLPSSLIKVIENCIEKNSIQKLKNSIPEGFINVKVISTDKTNDEI